MSIKYAQYYAAAQMKLYESNLYHNKGVCGPEIQSSTAEMRG